MPLPSLTKEIINVDTEISAAFDMALPWETLSEPDLGHERHSLPLNSSSLSNSPAAKISYDWDSEWGPTEDDAPQDDPDTHSTSIRDDNPRPTRRRKITEFFSKETREETDDRLAREWDDLRATQAKREHEVAMQEDKRVEKTCEGNRLCKQKQREAEKVMRLEHGKKRVCEPSSKDARKLKMFL